MRNIWRLNGERIPGRALSTRDSAKEIAISIPYLSHRFGGGLAVIFDSWGGGWTGGAVLACEPAEIIEDSNRPFEVLDAAVRELPECLWIGHITYDAGRHVEQIPEVAADDVQLPAVRFCAYPGWIEFRRGELVHQGDHRRALKLEREFRAASQSITPPLLDDVGPGNSGEALFSFGQEEFEVAVSEAIEHIEAGNFYQVNLAQRISVPFSDPPLLAQRIACNCPAPYGAYLDAGDFQIISASPELFLSVSGDEVVSSPIKGTRPRSGDYCRDRELARELTQSEKDRAENLMIVDLIRNDLGKVCESGSVRVPSLFELSSFVSVHHLVSTVTGRLSRGTSIAELLKAVFPGGSITGAPKVAAMEYIERTEPVRRGVYTGAVGMIYPAGRDTRLELNIAIRTITCKNGWAHLHVGAGIVADSVPSSEYQETLDKAAGLADAMGVKLSMG